MTLHFLGYLSNPDAAQSDTLRAAHDDASRDPLPEILSAAPSFHAQQQMASSSLSVCSRADDGDLNFTYFSALHDVYVLHAESPLGVRSTRKIEPVFFLSVVGGLSHLNFFLDVAPRGAVGLYDVNPFSVDGRAVLRLRLICD